MLITISERYLQQQGNPFRLNNIRENPPLNSIQIFQAYLKKKINTFDYDKNVKIGKATFKETCLKVSDLITKHCEFFEIKIKIDLIFYVKKLFKP